MSVLSWRDRFQLVARTLACASACLRQRKLAPIDSAMRGGATIAYRGQQLVIPFGEIDRALAETGDSPTFGVIREMFANDVYMRAFRTHAADAVVDLGANRGFFMLIARRIMGAGCVIGVEPLVKYQEPFNIICRRNGLDRASFVRYWSIIDSAEGENALSMQTLLTSNQLADIDFVKCDIEGGEYALFLQNNAWLDRVKNIAMELHHWGGDVSEIVEVLKKYGFQILLTDKLFEPTSCQRADYLYASRVGNLVLHS